MKTIFKLLVLCFAINQSVLPMENGITEPKKWSIAEYNKRLRLASLDGRLLFASHYGNHNKVEALISAGANVNHQGHFYSMTRTGGQSSLMIAAHNGNRSMCELLLSRGADPNLQDDDGWTALLDAISCGQDSVATLLLEHKATFEFRIPNEATDCPGYTPLGIAAIRARDTIAKLLLEYGADITVLQHLEDKRAILALAADCVEDDEDEHVLEDYGATCKALIRSARFNPIRTEEQLKISRQRVWAGLCALKRIQPNLPRDIRYLIFNIDPELQEDARNCAFGIHKRHHERTPFLPMQIVSRLIGGKLLDPELTVAAIKAHHIRKIVPHMQLAYADRFSQPLFLPFLEPEKVEENHGKAIEATIYRRLGLGEQSTAVASSQEDKSSIE